MFLSHLDFLSTSPISFDSKPTSTPTNLRLSTVQDLIWGLIVRVKPDSVARCFKHDSHVWKDNKNTTWTRQNPTWIFALKSNPTSRDLNLQRFFWRRFLAEIISASPVHLSIYLSIYLSINLPTYLPTNLLWPKSTFILCHLFHLRSKTLDKKTIQKTLNKNILHFKTPSHIHDLVLEMNSVTSWEATTVKPNDPRSGHASKTMSWKRWLSWIPKLEFHGWKEKVREIHFCFHFWSFTFGV